MASGELTPSEVPRPTRTELLKVWLLISVQSFGGGNATLELIRREFVVKRGWITEDEFARDWALCQTAPGMNLIAMIILIGRSLGGGPGVAVSMVGLLLPTGLITVALAVAFRATQGFPEAEAAMRGVVPATVGLGLASAYRTVRPLVNGGFARGSATRVVAVGLPLLGLSTLAWNPSIPALLIGSALVGAAAWSLRGTRASP